MTAEIAILNKTAVALAADSAVTISAGSKEEKIFDSADKLFELSDRNPIAIMIYNGMQFMETPLPSLIRQFRDLCPPVLKVEDAANEFLKFLNKFGEEAPSEVKDTSLFSVINPVLRGIRNRLTDKFQKRVFDPNINTEDYKLILEEIFENELDAYLRVLNRRGDANFIGDGGPLVIPKDQSQLIGNMIRDVFPTANRSNMSKLRRISKLSLQKDVLSVGLTGIVVAGFGTNELFPTLISYEIDGMICGRLKYIRSNYVDIDRVGTRAKVLPFAQKEMVERFLYGLDDGIERKVTKFCKETVKNIKNGVLDNIEFEDSGDRAALEKKADGAERAFLDGLQKTAFDSIRSQSQHEIEDMVEFMPKPELAKMAEALVNLTSIKRRVSRGMETVGGPIDVAIVSQAEGFVWVKRKHYFPPELNTRYLGRVQAHVDSTQLEIENGQKPQLGVPRSGRGGISSPPRGGERRQQPDDGSDQKDAGENQ